MPKYVRYGTDNPMYVFNQDEVVKIFESYLKEHGVTSTPSGVQIRVPDETTGKEHIFYVVPEIVVMVSNTHGEAPDSEHWTVP